ncbi:hypothetical protein [Kluyvera georgiana]|uniref:hypothetical protein n=1 Tax=Kluyvera georgiana TaxID=73098 RepID=UPI003F6640CA
MFFDEKKFERELEVLDFIRNKIKRCRKCGNELHYKEKFYNSDKICNKCKGMRPFDEIDTKTPTNIENNALTTPRHVAREAHYHLEQGSGETRTTTESDFNKKYEQWKLNNEKAERAWREKQSLVSSSQKQGKKNVSSSKVTDEKLNEIIKCYDLEQELNIGHEELISIVWEVLYHRGINNTF